MTAVPQNYTVHCLIDEACGCAALNSSFSYYMFMEGSLSEPAVQYCDEESSLSCTDELDSNDASTVDNQLTVTWNAKTVITDGDYFFTSTSESGDHDFLCATSYVNSIAEMASEVAFISVRGRHTLPMHKTRSKKYMYFTL